MQVMQVYASELKRFEWEDTDQIVLVAGEDIQGIPLEDGGSVDPTELVGGGALASSAIDVAPGSRWAFRTDGVPVVRSFNEDGTVRGTFGFLVSLD